MLISKSAPVPQFSGPRCVHRGRSAKYGPANQGPLPDTDSDAIKAPGGKDCGSAGAHCDRRGRERFTDVVDHLGALLRHACAARRDVPERVRGDAPEPTELPGAVRRIHARRHHRRLPEVVRQTESGNAARRIRPNVHRLCGKPAARGLHRLHEREICPQARAVDGLHERAEGGHGLVRHPESVP